MEFMYLHLLGYTWWTRWALLHGRCHPMTSS